jgi:NAD-dependent dihydropyrimidine dehydrogenase PreA subunit
MSDLRYLEDVVTLTFDVDKCTGCQLCTMVCPHGVFEMAGNRAKVVDRGACMECGACQRNCAFGAISVQSGVGCAAAIIASWFNRGELACGPTEGAAAAEAGCDGDGSSKGTCC